MDVQNEEHRHLKYDTKPSTGGWAESSMRWPGSIRVVPQRSAACKAASKIRELMLEDSEAREVIGFYHLPKSVRTKIYRVCLISQVKVNMGSHSAMETPTLLKACPEAAIVYFGENDFYFPSFPWMRAFLRALWREYIRLIRKITFDWQGVSATKTLSYLKKATALEELRIGIDEKRMTYEAVCRHSPGITPQKNVQVLLVPGMTMLRQIRKLKSVHFQLLPDDPNSGPIPGGVLTTVVAREMTTMEIHCDSPKCNVPFAFFKLPPEMRNFIYRLTLAIDGPVTPSNRTPTSAITSSRGIREALSRQYPHSVLALLQVSRGIYEEAVGFFYHINHFLFHFPLHFVAFMNATGKQRKSWIQQVTLWYRSGEIGDAFNLLKSLPALRKLHVATNWFTPNPETRPGFEILAQLRGNIEITITDGFMNGSVKLSYEPQGEKRLQQLSLLEDFVRNLNSIVNQTPENAETHEDCVRSIDRAPEQAGLRNVSANEKDVGIKKNIE